MTFFYDLNKRLAGLVSTTEQLNEGKTEVKDTELDEASYSAKSARAGKDIGKPGKAFGKIAADAAKRYGSKERGEKVAGAVLAKLRSKANEGEMEEGNEFSGELAKAKASGAKSFKVDGKEYPVKEDFGPLEEKGAKKSKPDYIDLDKDGNKKETMKKAAADKKKNAFDPEVARSMFSPEKGKTKTGHEVKDTGYSKRYTKSLKDEPEDSDDDAPKTKGRKAVGAGKGKKIGAKVKGTSKLHSKGSIAEDDTISLLDKGEYDQEGDMAKKDLKSIALAAKELHAILGDNQNLPEWVQSKITKALDYINSSNQYMHQEQGDEVVAEKAVSQQQQKFMGMAHAIQKGEKIKGASPELKKVAKTMKKSDVKDFAATKHEGLPKKVKAKEEEVEETTDAPKAKKSKGGIQFGQGVYENFNSKVETMITESMNVNVSMSTGQNGEPTKSITVSAEGDDAEMLAQLLNLAGLQGKTESDCGCGSTPCSCEQVDEVDENNPDWPTDEETTGEDDPQMRRWSSGLNGPKSTGQTTNAPFNRQRERQGAGTMAEATDLGMNLYKELKNFKAK